MLVFSLLPAAAFAEADEGTLLENAIGQALVPGDPEGQEEDPGNAPEHGANLGSGEEQQPPLGDTEEPPQPLGHAEEQPQPLGDTEGQSETLGLLRGEEENSGTPSVTGVSMQSHCPPARTYTVTFNSNGGSTVNS
ncbi:MAG: hypothetical protein EOM66_04520, partial [Clostridia bacterium]|nr:hypothetical protein [Clostridia bacterium]